MKQAMLVMAAAAAAIAGCNGYPAPGPPEPTAMPAYESKPVGDPSEVPFEPEVESRIELPPRQPDRTPE